MRQPRAEPAAATSLDTASGTRRVTAGPFVLRPAVTGPPGSRRASAPASQLPGAMGYPAAWATGVERVARSPHPARRRAGPYGASTIRILHSHFCPSTEYSANPPAPRVLSVLRRGGKRRWTVPPPYTWDANRIDGIRLLDVPGSSGFRLTLFVAYRAVRSWVVRRLPPAFLYREAEEGLGAPEWYAGEETPAQLHEPLATIRELIEGTRHPEEAPIFDACTGIGKWAYAHGDAGTETSFFTLALRAGIGAAHEISPFRSGYATAPICF